MRSNINTLIIAGMFAFPLVAQETKEVSDRGALMLRLGNDTVVTDRFFRSHDTLQGIVVVKGQARFEYVAALGPNDAVVSLSVKAYALGGAPGDAPLQRIYISMQGDSAFAETAAGMQRLGTRAGAIPMFNNALALTELFTRRARAAGGSAEIPYLVMNGGSTLTLSVKPVGADSVVVTIAGQEQRLKIDPRGRIIGGKISNMAAEFLRAGPAAADGLAFTKSPTGPSAKADYSAPAGAPYTAEDVVVAGPGGIILAGTLTRPTNSRAPFPVVVTITGSGPQDRDEYLPIAGGMRMFRQLADTLGRRGVAVLRMDDRGTGASGGKFSSATSADFADDIRAAVAYLRTRKDIDPERIALLGHSEGGMIAPMVAATDTKIKGIVLMAGPADKGFDISMAQNRVAIDHAPGLTQATRDSLYRAAVDTVGKIARGPNSWMSYWLNYDPAATARKVQVPVLILQGETDSQVSPDQAAKLEAAFRAGGNRNVTRRMLPARNHLFVEDADGSFTNYDKLKGNKIPGDVLGAVADWVARVLGAKTVVQ
jgi:dienelactone hydrolase